MDFGNGRPRINHGGKREQGEDGADHGESPNCPPHPIDHSPGAFIPEQLGLRRACSATARPALATVVN
jgi:hypothetical protein